MKNIVLILIILVLLFSACTERIDIDEELGENFPRYLMVEGNLSTDSGIAHTVKLSWSKSLDDDQPPQNVSGASVTIESSDNDFAELTEDSENPGYYRTPKTFFAKPGHKYNLTIDEVDIDNDGNYDVVTAADSVVKVAPLDSIALEWVDLWEAWAVKAYAQEPGDQENYYMFRTYVNDTLVSDTLMEVFATDDVFFNGSYINGMQSYFLNEEDPDEELFDGDTVTLEIDALTKKAFNFIIQAQDEAGYSAPIFSGPPSNVEDNVEGKNAVGFFMTYDLDTAKTIWNLEDRNDKHKKP